METHQVPLREFLFTDIPPLISSLYRSNYTNFWNEYLPKKIMRYVRDPSFDYTPLPFTQRPKPTHRNTGKSTQI